MAEGLLKSFDSELIVFSAGINPGSKVHPKAVQVMKETGIDISFNKPKNVEQFLSETFDYVITVCDNAKETCPVFTGTVKYRLHIGFNDPAEAQGTDEEVLNVFRRVRNEIKSEFYNFYKQCKGRQMFDNEIGFIGGGRITKIFLYALKRSGMFPKNIIVTEPDAAVADRLKAEFPEISVEKAPAETVKRKYIFISLHPPVFIDTLSHIIPWLKNDPVIISLAPKITIKKISDELSGYNMIIRMIPNAPSIIGCGFNPVVYGNGITGQLKNELGNLFSIWGKYPEVEESKIEAYALMTAMGPTYFWFQFYELKKLAQEFGLTENDFLESFNEMVTGAVNTMNSELTPGQIMDLVPVKPLGAYEETIRGYYNEALTGVYNRIKPV